MIFNKMLKILAVICISLGVGGLWMQSQAPKKDDAPAMVFSQLINKLDQNPEEIKSITIVNGSDQVKVVTDKGTQLITVPGKAGEAQILQKAGEHKVTVTARNQSEDTTLASTVMSWIVGLIPWVVILGGLWWLTNRQGGLMGGFTNKHKPITADADRKTFADIAGCEEAKIEAREIVDYLKNPGHFQDFGAKAPKGVLLVGPPGTGKTLMAKAIAGEAEASFFSVSGSDFVEMFVGVGASRVRSLFAEASKKLPAIIFIDEIDAVGKARGGGNVNGANDEREQTLNQLLTAMDGFKGNNALVVIAATNRPDVLDPALVRPGRFDRQILIDAPDVNGREEIFKIHTKGKPLAPDVNLRFIAERCPGFTGAEIAGACNEAATVAFRRHDAVVRKMKARNASEEEIKALPRLISLADFDEGIDRTTLGVAKTTRAKVMTLEDRTNTSIHELGHALLCELLEGGDPVSKITIMPRARALGYVQAQPEGDRFSISDKQIVSRMMMAMGGRAAQQELLGTIDTGAQNDFHQAYGLARRMVTEWGMSSLGPISVSGGGGNPFGRGTGSSAEAGPGLTDRIDSEVLCIVNRCLELALKLVKEHESFLRAANELLLKRETILAPEWRALLAEHKVPLRSVKMKLECGKPSHSTGGCSK